MHKNRIIASTYTLFYLSISTRSGKLWSPRRESAEELVDKLPVHTLRGANGEHITRKCVVKELASRKSFPWLCRGLRWGGCTRLRCAKRKTRRRVLVGLASGTRVVVHHQAPLGGSLSFSEALV